MFTSLRANPEQRSSSWRLVIRGQQAVRAEQFDPPALGLGWQLIGQLVIDHRRRGRQTLDLFTGHQSRSSHVLPRAALTTELGHVIYTVGTTRPQSPSQRGGLFRCVGRRYEIEADDAQASWQDPQSCTSDRDRPFEPVPVLFPVRLYVDLSAPKPYGVMSTTTCSSPQAFVNPLFRLSPL
jgi:hypothetical protein